MPLHDTEFTTNQMSRWLREEDPDRLDQLWARADEERRRVVGDGVHLRGLIEISNHCRRHCLYCGLRGPNDRVTRYRMTTEEILECARRAAELGFGTVVLQSGEDPGLDPVETAELIHTIKAETGLAVTLSLGERPTDHLARWREAGANRYLIRFETSDVGLFADLHPDAPRGSVLRVQQLRTMRDLGYEIGTGVMVGIPGQSYESLTYDIDLFRKMDIDMVGLGPYIANEQTPLRGDLNSLPEREQVPATEQMASKALALTRIVCPEANIPATTALATIDGRSGRRNALRRGANVIMPNLTPEQYARHYRIYPKKSEAKKTARTEPGWMEERLRTIGRYVADGPGNRVNRPDVSRSGGPTISSGKPET